MVCHIWHHSEKEKVIESFKTVLKFLKHKKFSAIIKNIFDIFKAQKILIAIITIIHYSIISFSIKFVELSYFTLCIGPSWSYTTLSSSFQYSVLEFYCGVSYVKMVSLISLIWMNAAYVYICACSFVWSLCVCRHRASVLNALYMSLRNSLQNYVFLLNNGGWKMHRAK